jgi:hypothetical protein
MSFMTYPKIIIFIAGSMPTAAHSAMAMGFGPGAVFRNAEYIQEGDTPEECDGVAGDVPAAYKDVKTAEAAIAEFNEKAKKLVQDAQAEAEAEAEAEADVTTAKAETTAATEDDKSAYNATAASASAAAPTAKTATVAQPVKGADWKPNA